MRRGAFSLILFGTADKMEDTFIIRIGDYHGRSQAEEEKPHHVPAWNRRQRHDLLSVHKLHHHLCAVYAKPHKRAFGAITAIVVAARIFDALNDPIMGNIIERTRTRWGKFKPWLVIGILSTSVVVYLAFNTDLQGWSFVWFFGVIYFMYSITYTMHDISYWGMVPALSTDANARNQFASRATLFAGIGGTLASVLIPMFTVGDMAIGGSTTGCLRQNCAYNLHNRSAVFVLHNFRCA